MKKGMLGTVLFFVTTASTSANNPASTAYVDQQIASTKTALVALINSNPVAHPVGSCYGGGVVFYVNTTTGAPAGQQGLIVALSDAPGSNDGFFVWQTGTTPVSTQAQYFTGLTNTSTILNTLGSSDAPAAYAASTYTTTETCSTCTAWYLPSRDELMTVFAQANSSANNFWTQCGGTAPNNAYYWTSTQFATPANAWYVQFNGGNNAGIVSATSNTSPGIAVRSVRTF